MSGKRPGRWAAVRGFFAAGLWEMRLDPLPAWKAAGVRLLRVLTRRGLRVPEGRLRPARRVADLLHAALGGADPGGGVRDRQGLRAGETARAAAAGPDGRAGGRRSSASWASRATCSTRPGRAHRRAGRRADDLGGRQDPRPDRGRPERHVGPSAAALLGASVRRLPRRAAGRAPPDALRQRRQRLHPHPAGRGRRAAWACSTRSGRWWCTSCS